MTLLVPPGYAGMVPLTISNPSSTLSLGGSTTTPVAVGSTDYVVTAQLTGSAASAVYTGASDQTSFTDVSVWWTNPSGTQLQLDVDYDTTTNGAWSTANVTLRFRLQAAIAPSGSDANYVVAFGNSLANVLRNWANIYPFWDTFAGTTLNSAKWTSSVASGASVVVNNGLTITAPAGAGTTYVAAVSSAVFGVNRLLESFMAASVTSSQGAPPNVGLSFAGAVGSAAFPNLCLSSSGPYYDLLVAPTNGAWGPTYFGTSSAATRHWRLGRDGAGSSFAYVDASSASNTASTQHIPEALPPWLLVTNSGNSNVGQITAQWIKVRPWNGPGLDPLATAGVPVYRTGRTIASSTSAAPLVRSGGRGIARTSSGTWLALYSDGSSAFSKSGASAAALASASAATVLSAASGVRGATMIAGGTDGTALAVLADTSGGNPPDVKTYNASTGLWSAGNATGLPAGATFAGTLYNSGATTYWHLLSSALSGTSMQHWVSTAQGGPFTALSVATTATLPSSAPCLMVALYAGNVIGATIDSTGHIAYATLDTRTATSGGSTISASTLPLTGSALATSENLALLNSLDDGSGDLYLAYNNGAGICVRISRAGGPLAWTAETQISSTAADSSTALVRDGTGAVTLFWISGAPGNPILSQRLQVVGGSPYLSGDTLARTTYAATRSLLSCVPSEPSGTAGLVWLES